MAGSLGELIPKLHPSRKQHMAARTVWKATARTAAWNGAELDVKSLLQPDVEYEISGYVKLDGHSAVPSMVKLTVEQQPTGGTTTWKTVAQTETADTSWIKLQGNILLPGDGCIEAVCGKLESRAGLLCG